MLLLRKPNLTQKYNDPPLLKYMKLTQTNPPTPLKNPNSNKGAKGEHIIYKENKSKLTTTKIKQPKLDHITSHFKRKCSIYRPQPNFKLTVSIY